MFFKVILQIISLLIILFGSLFLIKGFAEHNFFGFLKNRLAKLFR